jgi:hypothetical protein
MAERIVKWMLCVPKFKTTSPRFIYYADNWRIIDKIHRFVDDGTFSDTTSDCLAFGADEFRVALDYLDRPETAEMFVAIGFDANPCLKATLRSGPVLRSHPGYESDRQVGLGK